MLDKPQQSADKEQHLKSCRDSADSEAHALSARWKSVSLTRLLDKPEASSDKEQHLKSHPGSAGSEAYDLNTQRKSVSLTRLSDLQDSGAVPSKIVLKISTVQDQKTPPKKHASSKHDGSGKRDSVSTEVNDLLLNQPGKCKKSLNKDAVVKRGEKPELKVKKHLKSKSSGHDGKDGTDAKSLTTDKASAFSLNQPSESRNVSLDKCDSAIFAHKPQSYANSYLSSRTEGHDAEATADTVTAGAETVLSDKGSVLSSIESSKCTNVSPDIGSSVAEKPQSEVNSDISSVNEGHDTQDSRSSTLTALIGTDLYPSLPQEHKKSCNKDSTCEPGRKPKSAVKKHTKPHGEECSTSTKNVASTKVKTTVKGADVGLNSQKGKPLSSGNDGVGLSGQKVDARVKSVCSGRKVTGVTERGHAVIPDVSKSTNVSSGQPTVCKKSSAVTEKTELLRTLWRELDSGLRTQGSQPPVSSVSEGQCQDSKRSEISENAAKSLVPKRHKTHTVAHVTKESTTIPRSGVHLHNKHKWDQTSVLHPPHHKQIVGGISAAGDSVSRHYKIPHRQRHASSHPEHHAESTAVHISTAHAKKQDDKVSSFEAPDSANVCMPHPETLLQKNASESESHQLDSASVDSADAVQGEKPKNKVLSLAEYKKRKRDITSATAVTSSLPMNVGQSVDPLYMKSSLAEQLIVSYAERSESSGSVGAPAPVCSPEGAYAYGHAITAKQCDRQSENSGSFGDIYSFQLPGQTVLPSVQLKEETTLFKTNTSHIVGDIVDIQALSSSSGSSDRDANQIIPVLPLCMSDKDANQAIPVIPLSQVKCQPDYNENIAEMNKIVCVCSSGLSLATDPCDKTGGFHDTALESQTAVGGGDTGFVSSRFPLLSQTVDSDINGSDKFQFVSVSSQGVAAETLMGGSRNESDLVRCTSSSVMNLGSSKLEMMTEGHSEETKISSSDNAAKSVLPVPTRDVLEVQRQAAEQIGEQHYLDVDNLKKETVDVTDENHVGDDKMDVLSSLFQVLPGSEVHHTSAGRPRHDTTGRDVENTQLGIYIWFTGCSVVRLF